MRNETATAGDPAIGQAPARFRLVTQRRGQAAERRRLQAELAAALQAGAFLLSFTPRHSLRSGAVTGAQAVVRWPRARRGAVPTGAVLTLAEECGMVAEIGAWTLGRACGEAGARADGTVSVAISPRQIAGGGLLDHVRAALADSGLHPERLCLDLAEPALMALDAEALLTLSALRDLGVGAAVDDFGAELGSLGLLRRLPLTGLKLDRSLVRGLPAEREDAALVGAIVAAGHAMGLSVVAKSIETEAQRACLAALGCDEGQGYLFAHPEECEGWSGPEALPS